MRVFLPNPNFAEDAQGAFQDGLAECAAAVVPMVEAAARDAGAPWMPRSGHELIEVVREGEDVFIVNSDYAAHLQEYGSIRNPPFAPLRRGVTAAGLRVED